MYFPEKNGTVVWFLNIDDSFVLEDMILPRCTIENCGNTFKTSRGTYTFHNEKLVKSEAAKLCKKNGGIIAPLNTQEEFAAVHTFAYECDRWCGRDRYHVGLYVHKNETRFYSDCTEWDWEKHDKLYKSYIREGPCWETAYRTTDKIQKIYANEDCYPYKLRTICFKANTEAASESEAIIQSSNVFTNFNVLTILFAVLAFGMAVVSMKKNKKYELEIAELKK